MDFDEKYCQKKLDEYIKTVSGLIAMSPDKADRYIQTWMDLAYKLGKIRGMDIVEQRWAKQNEQHIKEIING